MPKSSESLIRPPVQRRSQESLERVLKAGLEVLQDLGFAGFTLQEVSRRARVSIGAIYARVPSREALILAIYERGMEQLLEEEEELSAEIARQTLSARELVEALAGGMVRLMLRNKDFLGVFMRQAPVDPEIRERGAIASHRVAKAFCEPLRSHKADIRHPDPELAIDIAYRFVYCTAARRLTHGPTFESPYEVPDDEFAQELARAAADYLLVLGSENHSIASNVPRRK